jgi:hypothetical protein
VDHALCYQQDQGIGNTEAIQNRPFSLEGLPLYRLQLTGPVQVKAWDLIMIKGEGYHLTLRSFCFWLEAAS